MRVYTVKSANKDHKDEDGNIIIPKGSTYYWWKFRRQPKIKSLTYPTPDQLDKYKGTRVSEVWEDLQGRVQSAIDEGEYDEELMTELDEFIQEEENKVDNIPEALEYSEQSESMRERLEEAENLKTEFEELEDE